MQKCKQCGVTAETARFYASNKSTCAECIKVGVRANRRAKLEYYLEYDRKRAFRPDRVAARKAYQARTGYHTGPVDAAKRAAHVMLGNALARKRIIKPTLCEACGRPERLDGHHYDYTKPLEVVWLCKPCHGQVHRYENEKARQRERELA